MEHRETATAYQRLVTAGEPVPEDALEHYRQWATAAYARYKETLTAIERDCQQRRRAAYAECYQAAYSAADELLRAQAPGTPKDRPASP